MTLSRTGGALATTRSLLNQLIELPELGRVVQALPAPTFAALVREIGVEDSGELIALATTEQLVQTFDEDLFISDHAGERETFDAGRFAVWLEVLLEAGERVAAARIAELDPDFVTHALSGLVLVLDEQALRERLDDADEDESLAVDKTLESALSEELDGYVVVAKQHEAWDAVLALLLALDQDHRVLFVRLLERLAQVSAHQLDDLAELGTLLSEGESLAEDVEGAREERRSKQGYVEARAARAFLALARQSRRADEAPSQRDALTRAYFRELERAPNNDEQVLAREPQAIGTLPAMVQRALARDHDGLEPAFGEATATSSMLDRFVDGLRRLHRDQPAVFAQRLEELAYLTNVLIAGHEKQGARLRPKAAADAAIATVCYGAVLEARSKVTKAKPSWRASPEQLLDVLGRCSADRLFRDASHALATGAAVTRESARNDGLLYSADELEAELG